MRFRSLLLLALGGSFACGGENPAAPAGPPASIDGDWYYGETFRDAAQQISCSDTGVISVAQVGDGFGAFVVVNGNCITPAGSFPFSDSGAVTGGHVSGNTVTFTAPGCSYSGTAQGTPPATVSGTLRCTQTDQGVTITLTGTWRATYAGDLFPPTASGTVQGQDGDTLAVPGDTVHFAVSGADARHLAWVGYRLGPPAMAQDSISATGKAFTGTLAVTVPSGWVGTSNVILFARDSAGHLGGTSAGDLSVIAMLRRPTVVVPMTPATSTGDAVFDPKRNMLYVSETDSQKIAVISVASGSFVSSIAAPGKPVGLDLTLGGDSLVVALRRSAQLGFVDLRSAQPTMSTVALSFDPSAGRGPDHVRVLANNQAIITLTFDGGGFGGNVLSYDLVAGTQRKRTDIGYNGGLVTENVPITPTSDRTRMFAMGGCCPGSIWVYTAATDNFVGPTSAGELAYPASFDATGDRYLTFRDLYDGNLNLIAMLMPTGYGTSSFGPTVISPDGSVAYFGTDLGYIKIHLPDAAVLEAVRIPRRPTDLGLLPDGNTLVVRTDQSGFLSLTNRLYLVDLRPLP